MKSPKDIVKEGYNKAVSDYFTALKLRCAQYNITYVSADIQRGFAPILSTFLVERKQFL